jgi:adenylate cyclase
MDLEPLPNVALFRPGRARAIAEELFANTVYYPIVLGMMMLTIEGLAGALRDPELYALVLGCALQAWFLGTRLTEGRPSPFLGNLIAPAVYSLIEVGRQGPQFLVEPRHAAYWGFALAVGLLQQLRVGRTGGLEQAVHVLESMVRTSVLVVGYWIFETTVQGGRDLPFSGPGLDEPMTFMWLTVLFVGASIGFANATARNYLRALEHTTLRLEEYSEWLLGPHVLARAIDDPDALAPARRHRTVLFLDIRGFTSFCEARPPEEVARMLNDYFVSGERVWTRHDAVWSKLSGDEILVVFPDARRATAAALELRDSVGACLARYGLTVGLGLHCGPLIEGALGRGKLKAYEVVGDVVNTAKRVCDEAEPNEVLVSDDVYKAIEGSVATLPSRTFRAKGKAEPVIVHPLADSGARTEPGRG